MKLAILKVANAIPCGSKTETVFQAAEYEIEEYDNFKLKITHKSTKNPDGSKVIVHTSFFNSVYWKYMPTTEAVTNEPEAPKQPSRRGPKPKEV